MQWQKYILELFKGLQAYIKFKRFPTPVENL